MTDLAATLVTAVPREDTFDEFYAATVGPLGGYAYRLLGDAELAADVVQESYTRLLSRWVAVRRPRPYLFHVATNLAREAWRTRQRGDETVRGLIDGRPDVTAPAADNSVRDAIARLPKRHREVVLLHYYGDLTLADVAAAVRRPLGTVKRLVAEARDLLAGTLGDAG
jgi:RNA polymerase sigma-70 factor (ECF subfamily)